MTALNIPRGTAAQIGAIETLPTMSAMILAMAASRVVAFDYDDKLRVVEIHSIGRSPKDGSLLMRGYQVDGEASRPLPQWTLFSMDKVVALSITPQESEAPRDGYKMGDRQMSPVLAEIEIREDV